ncbi:MAG: flagellar biosynthetic protein FliO [Kiloniellales bacterium]|nr:flagellar biosynthetic protein FliO [Kiloniellales bacterium]
MDIELYFRFLLALAAVIGLILALAWAVRRFGPGARLLPNSGQPRRLSIQEVASVDARRRLILLRRDGTEYLVLLGPTQDLLLDKGFGPTPKGGIKPGVRRGETGELSVLTGGQTP